MIFKGTCEQGEFQVVDYATTWKYGYKFMLDAVQIMINTDFIGNDLQRVASGKINGEQVEWLEDVKRYGNIVRMTPGLQEEWAVLIVSGVSQTMQVPIQLMFFNQTNAVRVVCPVKKFIEDKGEHVFDNFVNSLEIKAYCEDTRRKTIEEMKAS
jgi:hypothetical protein